LKHGLSFLLSGFQAYLGMDALKHVRDLLNLGVRRMAMKTMPQKLVALMQKPRVKPN
jgi:hypothetical protein